MRRRDTDTAQCPMPPSHQLATSFSITHATGRTRQIAYPTTHGIVRLIALPYAQDCVCNVPTADLHHGASTLDLDGPDRWVHCASRA